MRTCSDDIEGPEVCNTHYETNCETTYKTYEVEQDEPVCVMELMKKCEDVTRKWIHYNWLIEIFVSVKKLIKKYPQLSLFFNINTTRRCFNHKSVQFTWFWMQFFTNWWNNVILLRELFQPLKKTIALIVALFFIFWGVILTTIYLQSNYVLFQSLLIMVFLFNKLWI